MSEKGTVGRRKGLTKDQIVTRALAMMDDDRDAKLAMRSLAKSLGVDPMALYHHFANRDELLDAVLARLFEEVELPGNLDGRWQDAVLTIARVHLEIARRHPNVFPLLGVHPRAIPSSFPLSEALYDALARTGLHDRTVIQAGEAIVSYTVGYALSDIVGAIGKPRDWNSLSDLPDHKPDGWLCNLRERGQTDRPSFEVGLGFVIAGIEAGVS